MSDVGPEQVECRHLDGDQKYRVDSLLYGGPDPTDLEDAVLGNDLHRNVSVGTVGQEVKQCSQVDEYAEEEIDNTGAAVEDDPHDTDDSVEEESNISFREAPDLFHDGSESAHVVLDKSLHGRDSE